MWFWEWSYKRGSTVPLSPVKQPLLYRLHETKRTPPPWFCASTDDQQPRKPPAVQRAPRVVLVSDVIVQGVYSQIKLQNNSDCTICNLVFFYFRGWTPRTPLPLGRSLRLVFPCCSTRIAWHRCSGSRLFNVGRSMEGQFFTKKVYVTLEWHPSIRGMKLKEYHFGCRYMFRV